MVSVLSIMGCALFASAVPISKTSCGRVGAAGHHHRLHMGDKNDNSAPKFQPIRREAVRSYPPCQINLPLPLSASQRSRANDRKPALSSSHMKALPEAGARFAPLRRRCASRALC